MRATVKDDLKASPADFVYGALLSIPGDMMPTLPAAPPAEFLHRLRSSLCPPVPALHHLSSPPPVNLPAETRIVFIQRDQASPPPSQKEKLLCAEG